METPGVYRLFSTVPSLLDILDLATAAVSEAVSVNFLLEYVVTASHPTHLHPLRTLLSSRRPPSRKYTQKTLYTTPNTLPDSQRHSVRRP